MRRVDEIRAEIVGRIEQATADQQRAVARIEIADRELAAHDAAVEAIRSERPALSPATLGPGGRAKRRNIKALALEALTDTPKTLDRIIETIGNVKVTAVIAALDKLIMDGSAQKTGTNRWARRGLA